jgi:hypothetical protein
MEHSSSSDDALRDLEPFTLNVSDLLEATDRSALFKSEVLSDVKVLVPYGGDCKALDGVFAHRAVLYTVSGLRDRLMTLPPDPRALLHIPGLSRDGWELVLRHAYGFEAIKYCHWNSLDCDRLLDVLGEMRELGYEPLVNLLWRAVLHRRRCAGRRVVKGRGPAKTISHACRVRCIRVARDLDLEYVASISDLGDECLARMDASEFCFVLDGLEKLIARYHAHLEVRTKQPVEKSPRSIVISLRVKRAREMWLQGHARQASETDLDIVRETTFLGQDLDVSREALKSETSEPPLEGSTHS